MLSINQKDCEHEYKNVDVPDYGYTIRNKVSQAAAIEEEVSMNITQPPLLKGAVFTKFDQMGSTEVNGYMPHIPLTR